ncbi:peptidylprolyl isomerase [Alginatibacterium sediminis]|uniref:Peptidyl-prolyl cis-trans isomerase n=1 Tax=Alginatibacterium sediminis TaxID=2164068 RepID=A0A420EGN2_9ALTE|nr:FKBP-type peptidyl-prolyl cis-trans isomerase [Alginatibacterium sediminis]RKF19838.1 peptidylprolyl isomerase [Alginatibacterium sediminis]
MQVQDKTVVSFRFKLFNQAGELVDESGEQPLLYLVGQHGMLPGLAKSFLEKSKGDSYSLDLSAEEGFGERKADSAQRVSRNKIFPKTKLSPGQDVVWDSPEGQIQVTVIKSGLKMVDIDTNHPLAGEPVRFDVEITDVRVASDDEVAHGHAHGAGGHEHH